MNPVDFTEKLYDADAYATFFDATLLSVTAESEKNSRPVYRLLLDRTLFFPEEGGQSPDCGVLTQYKDGMELSFDVFDVQLQKNLIYHTVSPSAQNPSAVPDPNFPVHGQIDWKHRFSNMQQHSGEHIFSGIVHRLYGFENVGFHLSNQTVTMDYNGVLSTEQVAEVELLVNRAISENVEITAGYPSKEELSALDYRSKKEIDGAIRIVTVSGYDICACCAPHVKRTGEIGLLKVMQVQNYKGGVRLTILCGFRALAAFSEKQATLSALTRLLSTSEEALADSVKKMKNTISQLKYDLSNARRAHLLEKAAVLPKEERNVLFFEPALEPATAREVVTELSRTHDGFCGIFHGEESNYNYIITGTGCDCTLLATQLRKAFGAKGGGSAQMIQGHVDAPKEAIIKLIQEQDTAH